MRPQVNGFTLSCLSFTLLATLSGCTATSKKVTEYCAHVVASPVSDDVENYYTAMVVRVDDEAVIMQPQYELKAGKHQLRIVELIDTDKLSLPASERYYRDWKLELEPQMRYYIAARFLSSEAGDYWQPVVWKKEPIQCIVGLDNTQSLTVDELTTSVSDALKIYNASSTVKEPALSLETEPKSKLKSQMDISANSLEATVDKPEQKSVNPTTHNAEQAGLDTVADATSLEVQDAQSKSTIQNQVTHHAKDKQDASSLKIEVMDATTADKIPSTKALSTPSAEKVQSKVATLSVAEAIAPEASAAKPKDNPKTDTLDKLVQPAAADSSQIELKPAIKTDTSPSNKELLIEVTDTQTQDKNIKNEQELSKERSALSSQK